jgi:hypothetical protein
MLAATGCGSKSPAGPTSNGSQNNFTPGPLASVPVYVGQVQLSGGVTGTLLLRPSALFAAVISKRPEIVNVILDLFGATLHAQGSAASGELILPTAVIDLTGTYNGSIFNVSGGGYALTVGRGRVADKVTSVNPRDTPLILAIVGLPKALSQRMALGSMRISASSNTTSRGTAASDQRQRG